MLSQFCKGQLDYIFFVYGLAFILLAACTYTLNRDPQKKLPWKWLGLFGLIHGINEWLDLIALNVAPNEVFACVRLATIVCSFLFLLEFGRVGTICLSGRGPNRMIFLPLFALMALGMLEGMTGLQAMTRHTLGFAGALWSGWVLVRLARVQTDHRKPLTAAGLTMILYAVASGVIGPKCRFFALPFLNHEDFSDALGIPIQLVRGILAIILSVSIWTYCQNSIYGKMLRVKGSPRLGLRLSLGLAVILLGGWLTTYFVGRSAEWNMKKSLLLRAKMVAAGVDRAILGELSGSEADQNKPAYRAVKEFLHHLCQSNADCRFLYLVNLQNSKVVFMVDSEHPDSKD